MEFVVHLLKRVFDKDHEMAVWMMFEIHNEERHMQNLSIRCGGCEGGGGS